MKDIEIARNTKLESINTIAKKAEIPEEFVEQFGKYKAKITDAVYEQRKGQKDGTDHRSRDGSVRFRPRTGRLAGTRPSCGLSGGSPV